MWRILRQEHGLPDYQGAHLWGPGFGDEAAAEIMLAPRDVNLIWQSGRAEKFLREDLPDMAQAASRHFGSPSRSRLRAVAPSHPGTVAGGAALKEVQYTFSIAADGQEVVLEKHRITGRITATRKGVRGEGRAARRQVVISPILHTDADAIHTGQVFRVQQPCWSD